MNSNTDARIAEIRKTPTESEEVLLFWLDRAEAELAKQEQARESFLGRIEAELKA